MKSDRKHRRSLQVVETHSGAVVCRLKQSKKSDSPACHGCSGCVRDDRSFLIPLELVKHSCLSEGHGTGGSTAKELEFEVSSQMLLALSLLVYLPPVLLMLLFAVGCHILYPGSDALVALAAVGGFGIGLIAVYLRADYVSKLQATEHLSVRSH